MKYIKEHWNKTTATMNKLEENARDFVEEFVGLEYGYYNVSNPYLIKIGLAGLAFTKKLSDASKAEWLESIGSFIETLESEDLGIWHVSDVTENSITLEREE